MSDHPHLFIVLNPVAGHVQADTVYKIFTEIFESNGIKFDVYETTGQENVTEIVREALTRNYSMIVAVGGDGTVSQVANGLVKSDIPLGIVPLGTGNLVARELRIPLTVEEACQLLVGSHTLTQLDVMQIGSRAFVPHISLGLYSQIIENTTIEEKRRFGMAAYFWQALQEISQQQSWKVTISVDNQKQRVHASLIIVANIGTIGIGALRWGNHIRPDDGEVDVCIVQARTVRGYLSTFWHLLKGQPWRAPETLYLRAKEEVVITADRPIPVRLDGENFEQLTIRIEVIPRAIKVITPLIHEEGEKVYGDHHYEPSYG
jgi:YegS/Rv2252/BmrU family lipid kinase